MTNALQLFTTISTLLGIIVLAFTAGYNWRRISALEDHLANHLVGADKRLVSIEATYARKDLIDLEIKAIRSRLDYMSTQLAALLDRMEQRRHE